MLLSRCLGVHLEMEEEVPSRGEPFVFSESSLRPKLPVFQRLVPQVRLSSWWLQRKLLSLKGKGKDSEVLGRDVCI
jgi:hypothetical protein